MSTAENAPSSGDKPTASQSAAAPAPHDVDAPTSTAAPTSTSAAVPAVNAADMPRNASSLAAPEEVDAEEERIQKLMLKYPRPAYFDQDGNDDNPEERANIFSIWSLQYLSDVVSIGFNRPVMISDMWKISKEQNTANAAPALEALWLDRIAKADEENIAKGFPPVNPDLNNLTPESRSTRMNSMGSRSDASRPASGSISGTDNVGASTSNSTPGASTGGAPGSGTDGDKPPERIEPSLFKSCVALMTWDMGKICFLQAGIRVEQIYESVVLGYLLSWLATDSPVPGFVEEEFYKGFIYGIGLVLMYVGQNVCNNRSYSVGFHVFCTIRSALNGMIYTKAIKVASVDAANDAGQRTGVSGGPMMGGGGAGAGNSGQIVNLMSVDSEKVGMMFFMGLNVVFIPAQLAVIIYFIYELVGVAIFAGLGVIMIILPLIFFIMLFMGRFMVKRAILGDSRVKLTNELLQGIRIVKFYAWEFFFERQVEAIRANEVHVLFQTSIVQMIMTFFFSIAPALIAAVTFSVFAALEDDMNPVIVFRTLALINSLQAPLIQLPASLANIMMGMISMERIRQFLLLPELTSMRALTSSGPRDAAQKAEMAARIADPAVMLPLDVRSGRVTLAATDAAAAAEAERRANPEPGDLVDGAVALSRDSENVFELDECAFSWEIPSLPAGPSRGGRGGGAAGGRRPPRGGLVGMGRAKRVQVLNNVTFHAPRGKITAIVGPVGCGKSSLVAGLLGELTKLRGTVRKDFSMSLAYVSQSAWIQTMSIQRNILFDTPLDSEDKRERYEHTIDVCALRPDLKTLDMGDMTEIGDRGINLSGGQKQRVSIARAVYADADVVIFDDPLSAVDAHVAEQIFSQCIEGALAGKTRILVTNQLHFLSRCDNICVMGQSFDDTFEPAAAANAAASAAAAAGNVAGAVALSPMTAAPGSGPAAGTPPSAPLLVNAAAASPGSGAGPGRGPASGPGATAGPADGLPGAGPSGNVTGAPQRRMIGHIAEQGTFAELLANGAVLPGLLQQYYSSLERQAAEEEAAAAEKAELFAHPADLAKAAAGGESGLLKASAPGPLPAIVLETPTHVLSQEEREELARTVERRRSASNADIATPHVDTGAGADATHGRASAHGHALAVKDMSLLTSNTTLGHTPSAPAPVVLSAGARREHESMPSPDTQDKEEAQHQAEAAQAASMNKVARIGGGLRKGQQITDEELNTDKVSWDVYFYHFRTMGSAPMIVALFVTTLLSQAAQAIMSIWLSWWSDDTFGESMQWYLDLYLILLACLAVLTLLRGFTFAVGNVNASKYYHHRLLRVVLRARSVFFDTTPVGRVLNRFSKDIDAVDSMIPSMLQQVLTMAFSLLASVITVSIIIPYFTIGLVFIIVVFIILHQYYSAAAIQLQRLESNTRSPLFQHFSETIKGMTTIRAFRRIESFQRHNFALSNINTNILYCTRQIYRWGGLRIGLLQSLMLLVAVLVIVLTRGDLATGLAGSALTYILSIGNTMGFLVMMAIELSSKMNSIERLKFYMFGIESEPSLNHGVDDHEPAEAWPQLGVIEYKNVYMRYRPELPLVLNGLSFTIQAGMKIGVVGRTGSGKSSLMMLLMRLYEIESGQILIDGEEISKLALHRLRGSIGIVPQESIMFSGTLRENVDPFGHFTDDEIYDALDQVALKDFALGLAGQLDSKVKEFGTNFSVGQRQLICMARVLLKRPRILLLDEATSSVDSETDSLLQRALQKRFNDCTVLTIAHRLNTVMTSDKIMVLDQGTLAEFDSPQNLLKGTGLWEGDVEDPNAKIGMFAAMYKAYLANNQENTNKAATKAQ